MAWLRENNKVVTPFVRMWINKVGDMATVDYGSHDEFLYFYGTVEEINKLVGI